MEADREGQDDAERRARGAEVLAEPLPAGAATITQGREQASWLARRELLRPRLFLTLVASVFLCLYASVVALQWVVLRRQAVEEARDNARTVTELLAMDLASTSPLSEMLARPGEPGSHEALDGIVRRQLGKFGLIKSKIYDPSGKLVYADDRALVGQSYPIIGPFREALSGAVASRIVMPEDYEERYGLATPTPMVETYLPLQAGGRTAYVFETYQDFAPAEARVRRRVGWSGAVLAVVMGAGLTGLIVAYRWIHRLQVQVQSLELLLPICTACKRIRAEGADASHPWVTVETYFGERDRLQFTHGMCPDCLAKFTSQLRQRKGRQPVADVKVSP